MNPSQTQTDYSAIIDSLTGAAATGYALSQGAVVQNGQVTSASIVNQNKTNILFLLVVLVVGFFAWKSL